MKINIDDNTVLSAVKQNFNSIYPFLKLEFFYNPALHGELYSRENMVEDAEKTVGEIRHLHFKGDISLRGDQKVSTLEHHFIEEFGISAQVFRKSGSIWLETTSSDGRTLAELNQKGEEMEIPFKTENIPGDIHEQE